MILARMPRIPVEAWTGISAPDRNICGKISSGTPIATVFWSCVRPMKKTPRAPPARARTGVSAMTRSRSPGFIGICMITIMAMIPTSETMAATPDPMSLPRSTENREIGATKSSAVKSFSRSSTRLVTPVMVPWYMPLAIIPMSMNGR